MRRLIYLFSILYFVALQSCNVYRMPKEGEVSTIPDTNNPSHTRQGQSWTPGSIGY